jgi:hypothetical protein
VTIASQLKTQLLHEKGTNAGCARCRFPYTLLGNGGILRIAATFDRENGLFGQRFIAPQILART